MRLRARPRFVQTSLALLLDPHQATELLWVDKGDGTFAWDPKLPLWMHDGIAMVLTTQAMHDAWWELHRLVLARHENTHPKFVEMDQANELMAHIHSSPTEFGALQSVIREGLKPLASMSFIETAAPPALSTRSAVARATSWNALACVGVYTVDTDKSVTTHEHNSYSGPFASVRCLWFTNRRTRGALHAGADDDTAGARKTVPV